MFSYFLAWLAILVAFLVIDGIWLGVVARSFYQTYIGELMREQIWFGVAALFYLFYAAAVLVLVSVPAFKSGSLAQALLLGAVLGLCAYGTYDITNLATLRGWPWIVSVVDMIWGSLITATVAAVGYQVLTMIRPA